MSSSRFVGRRRMPAAQTFLGTIFSNIFFQSSEHPSSDAIVGEVMEQSEIDKWLQEHDDFGVPAVMLDDDGKRLIACTRSFAAMFAIVTPPDLNRVSLGQLFVDQSAFEQWPKEITENFSVRSAVALRRFDGDVFVANCRIEQAVIGDRLCKILFVHLPNDKANTGANNRYQALFSAATVPMIVIGESGIVEEMNRATTDVLGYQREDLLGKNIKMAMPEPFRSEHDGYLIHYIKTGENRVIGLLREVTAVHKSGEEVPMELNVAVVVEGGKRHFLGTLYDIRSRKEATQRALMSEKLATIGEMSASVAHEINNPLTVILGFGEKLVREVSKIDSDQGRKLTNYCETVVSMAARIGKIVRSLRIYARNSASDPMEHKSVASVIEFTMDLTNYRLKTAMIEFRCPEIDPTLVINCREIEISQILTNLFNNSVDAIGNISDRWIALDAVREQGWIMIKVSDSGPGIPPEVRKKLMQPFYTTKGAGKGTGLGLSLSRRMAAAHGGSLELDENSSNTCFILRLPAIS